MLNMQQNTSIKAIHDLARRNQICAEYRLENESGPSHAKTYTVRLHLGDKNYLATGQSMKLAQNTAAQLALDDHRHLPLTNSSDLSPTYGSQSPTTALNTWATRNHIPTQYVLLNEHLIPTSPNRSRPLFYYRLYLGHDLYFDGHGSTHQQARTSCALNAFHFLRQNPISPPSTPQLSSSPATCKIKSEISLLYERAKHLGLHVQIEYHDPLTVTYHIGDKYSVTGKGSTQHLAKQSAAEQMLAILPLNNTEQSVNPITRVYQLAQLRQVKTEFVHLFNQENFTFQLKFGENDLAEGRGNTKQMAKRAAAEALLEKLDPVVVLPPPPAKGLLKRDGNTEHLNKQEKKHVHFVEEVIEKDEQSSTHQSASTSSYSSKHQLTETCAKLRIHVDYFDEMNENENAGSSRYQSTVSLSRDTRILAQFRGHGPSLPRAQENASSAAWNNFRQIFNGSIQASKSQRNNSRPISIEQ